MPGYQPAVLSQGKAAVLGPGLPEGQNMVPKQQCLDTTNCLEPGYSIFPGHSETAVLNQGTAAVLAFTEGQNTQAVGSA